MVSPLYDTPAFNKLNLKKFLQLFWLTKFGERFFCVSIAKTPDMINWGWKEAHISIFLLSSKKFFSKLQYQPFFRKINKFNEKSIKYNIISTSLIAKFRIHNNFITFENSLYVRVLFSLNEAALISNTSFKLGIPDNLYF